MIEAFLSDTPIGGQVSLKALYKAYREWCKARRIHAWSITTFNITLGNLGFSSRYADGQLFIEREIKQEGHDDNE